MQFAPTRGPGGIHASWPGPEVLPYHGSGGSARTVRLRDKRIYKKLTSGAEEYTFYGARGQKLGVYNLMSGTASALRTNVWFAGQLISENGSTVFQDRVGANRASGARFYPYGDEITSTANDRQKFGTYTRDSYTGLDYADQRFYASSYGRFNRPDPSRKSMHPKRPLSWNRYSYVSGDPINHLDRHGTDQECDEDDGDCCYSDDEDCCEDGSCCEDGTCCGDDCGGGGGPPPPPPDPTCNIQLFEQPAVIELSPYVHTYLGVTVGSSTVYLEAGPTNADGSAAGPTSALLGNSYLNTLMESAPGSHSYMTTSTLDWQSGLSASACPQASELEDLSATFPQNKYMYGFPDTNSNSYTYSLLKNALISLPQGVSASLLSPAVFLGYGLFVPRAAGWGDLLSWD